MSILKANFLFIFHTNFFKKMALRFPFFRAFHLKTTFIQFSKVSEGVRGGGKLSFFLHKRF